MGAGLAQEGVPRLAFCSRTALTRHLTSKRNSRRGQRCRCLFIFGHDERSFLGSLRYHLPKAGCTPGFGSGGWCRRGAFPLPIDGQCVHQKGRGLKLLGGPCTLCRPAWGSAATLGCTRAWRAESKTVSHGERAREDGVRFPRHRHCFTALAHFSWGVCTRGILPGNND